MTLSNQKAERDYFRKVISGNKGKAICFVAEVDIEIVGYLSGVVAKSESWRTL